MEWRVIAASYEFLLVNLWKDTWAETQYACMPKRGVADAWIDILTRLTDKERPVVGIIGYDLAKFFDTVYQSTIRSMMYDFPDRIIVYMEKLMRSQPKIRPQDRRSEKTRLEALAKERPIELWPEVEDFMTSSAGPMHNDYTESFPQGLNVSPIMSCRALQDTGAILNDKIVQYVDDGLIFNQKGDPELTISEFKAQLLTPYTGITISESKSEVIMKDSQWLKPLKFLGCSYDGKTFKASTRKGVFIVKDADKRIAEIIEWLTKNRNLLGNYRKMLTSLIDEGWNPRSVSWWSVPSKEGTRRNQLVTSFSTWWEGSLAKVERLPINAVESMAIESLGPKVGPIMSSSNTATMVSSYYLLDFLNTVKGGPVKRIGKGYGEVYREPNRLLADW